MRQREIVWIKLPFSNMEEEKIRPALVVSNTQYNSANLDIVVCAITSNTEEKPFSVSLDQRNLESGKLPIKSRIRADKIIQIEKVKILKPFAKVNSQIFGKVVNEISKLIKEE